MLKEIDTIPWASLSAKNGSAEKVPLLLRKVQAKGGAKAIDELAAILLPDGEPTLAALHAVPFVVELAASREIAERARLVLLLAELAAGPHAERLVSDELPAPKPPKAAPRKLKGTPTAAELRTFTHAAVRAAEEEYLKLLAAAEPDVRSAAGLLVAFTTEPKSAAAKLVPRLRKEADPFVKASWLIALGVIERRAGSKKYVDVLVHFTGDIEEEWPTPPPPVVATAAAVGLGIAAREQLTASMLERLRKPKLPKIRAEQLPWNGGDLAGLVSALRPRFEEIDVAAELQALEELEQKASKAKASKTLEEEHGARWITLLDRLFASHAGREGDPLLPEELTRDQRAMIESAARGGSRFNSAQHGLTLDDPFGSGITLERYLGILPQGPLERRIFVGKDGPCPIWKWFHLVADDKVRAEAVGDAILSASTATEVVALARDATSMAYPTDGEGRFKQSPRARILLLALDSLGDAAHAPDMDGIRGVLERLGNAKWPGPDWKGGPMVPAAAPTGPRIRRFAPKGKPDKFVQLELGNKQLTIAKPGKQDRKAFETPEQARARFEELSREQVDKGLELTFER